MNQTFRKKIDKFCKYSGADGVGGERIEIRVLDNREPSDELEQFRIQFVTLNTYIIDARTERDNKCIFRTATFRAFQNFIRHIQNYG